MVLFTYIEQFLSMAPNPKKEISDVKLAKKQQELDYISLFEKVQMELEQMGLLLNYAETKVYSTEREMDGKKEEVKVKTDVKISENRREAEVAEAKVDTAEERMVGEIGGRQDAAKIGAETKVYSTQREGEGKTEEAKVKTEVKIFENRMKADVAETNAELAMKKAEWARMSQVAEVEANKAVAIREVELQMEVERRNALKQTEKLKAEMLNKAIDDGIKVPETEKQKAAEAALQHNTSKRRKWKGINPRWKPPFTPGNTKRRLRYTKHKEAEGVVSLAQGAARMQRKEKGKAEEVKVKMDVSKAVEITEVEHKNALKEIERLKAEKLSNVEVEHQKKIKEEDLLCYRKMKAADASLYEQQKEANAAYYVHQKKVEAENDAKKKQQKETDAASYVQHTKVEAEKKKAEGLIARWTMYGRAVTDVLEGILRALTTFLAILRTIVNDIWPLLIMRLHAAIV